MTILGEGDYRYRVLEGWGTLPEGWLLHEVAAVGVGARDEVFVFNRGPRPMIVFDRLGNVLRDLGADIFTHAHGIQMLPDGTMLCTDDGDHTVRHCTPDGKVLMTIGVPARPSPFMSVTPVSPT